MARDHAGPGGRDETEPGPAAAPSPQPDRVSQGDPTTAPRSAFFRVRQDLSQNRHIEGLPFGTVGGILARTTVPLDGDYVLQPRLIRTNLGVMLGLEYEHQLEITVDGWRVHLATFGGTDDFREQLENQTKVGDDVDARLKVRVPIRAGPHEIGVATRLMAFYESGRHEGTFETGVQFAIQRILASPNFVFRAERAFAS